MTTSPVEPSAMRIGLVSDHLFPYAHGGAERVYRVLADAISDQGADLTYFTRQDWPAGAELKTTFKVRAVWEGNLYDQGGTRRVGAALRWSIGLMRVLWRSELDVLVVSATPVFNVFVGGFAKLRRPRMELVVDWLEIWPRIKWRSYSGNLSGTIAWVLQNLALRIGSLRLVNSSTTLERLPRSVRAKAIQLPLASMAGTPVALGAKTEARLLFVGRHIPDKNLPMLPRVVAALLDEFPEVSALVVGDGPDRAVTAQLSNELGVSDRILFAGRLSDEELEEQLENAAALFFPSVREGFGLVVCEAARHGTPSIVVNHPDNAAVALVTEGVNGAVASELDIELLVEATRRVLRAGAEMQARTKDWYDAEYLRDGGFENVARRLIGLG